MYGGYGYYGGGGGLGWMIILIAMGLSVFAQSRINSTYRKYSTVYSKKGVTGAEAARMILNRYGLGNIPIEVIGGTLTDHYDPGKRVLRLSNDVYHGMSLASIGVAAHEVGHAVQHSKSYAPLAIRNTIFPIVSISSKALLPILLLGFLMNLPGLVSIGILLFAVTTAFQLITLPVEFDASRRAVVELEKGIVSPDEIKPVKQVLNAAALTYVAAALASLGQLLRLMGSNRRRN